MKIGPDVTRTDCLLYMHRLDELSRCSKLDATTRAGFAEAMRALNDAHTRLKITTGKVPDFDFGCAASLANLESLHRGC
jgi:hypothetical protein